MPHPKVKIADNGGNEVAVTDNALDVNIAGGGFSGAITAADNAIVILGAKADAKSAATDGTEITAMQVLKQISASVQETATDADNSGIATLLVAIDSDTSSLPSIKTSVQKIDNAIYDDDSAFTLGSSDIVAIGGFAGTQTITSNQIGALSCTTGGALYTTHGITGGADGITTDDTNGTVLGGDVNCKKIDIQALTDNTGVIAVGFTGVDATVATGTGILLNAGDVYSLEINNLNLIYIEASINTDGVRYTYFT